MGTTGTLTVTHDRIGSVQHTNRGVLNNYPSYIAGYEGANSRVCLAHSTDGKEWTSVPTKTSFNGWTVPISRQIPTVSTVRNIWVAKTLVSQMFLTVQLLLGNTISI